MGTWNLLSLRRSGHFQKGNRRVGRSALRWLDSIEDLKKTGCRIAGDNHMIRQMAVNRERGQGSSWNVVRTEETEEVTINIFVAIRKH